MARRGTILQDVVRREVQKLIGFALLNLSWFNPFVLHHGKAHWQWLWQVHKYLVEPWQELKWGQVTSETKRCTFTSPLRTSWTQQRSHGPQGGRASFGLWSVLEDHFCEACESMFRMKATHVQKFFSLGGLLKCPYPLLSAIETKINVSCIVSISRRILPDILFELWHLSTTKNIATSAWEWLGWFISIQGICVSGCAWVGKAPEFLGFWPHNWSPQAWHLVSSSGMG